MADNEIKILKTNTFEEWRQKSNEVSLNVGADDRLDSRLTDRVFKHDNVSGLKLNIIDGADDDNKTQVFQLIPDTTVDNTNGYIILTDSYSIPGAFVKGATVSQTGGYSAVIESVTTIDNKPKILVKNSSGDFNASQDLSIGGTSIPNANILRLVSEAYDKASVRVLNGSTELVQGLLEANFHVPNVSGKITLAGSPDLTNFTEGTLIYQGDPSTPASASTSDIEENATWYARVYHAGSSEIYIKTHSGTYSSSVQVKVQGFTTTNAKLTAAQHTGFTVLDQTVGHIIELNKSATANDDIKVIATDLVTAINEVQDDIGQVESLNTRYGTKEVVHALNQVDDHLYDSGVSFTGLSADSFKEGINELRAELGNHNNISNATGYSATTAVTGITEIQGDIGNIDDIQTTHTSTLVGSINEIEEALRGTNLANYTLGTDSADGIVGGINEIEAALRGSNGNYTVTAGSNIRDGLNAVYADIHTTNSVTLNTDASHLVGAVDELHDAVRGSNADYTLTTDSSNIVAAINELEGALRGTTANYVTWPTGEDTPHLSATDIRGAVVELGQTIGNGTITGTGTAAAGAGNLTTAINLIDTEIGSTTLPTTDQTVTGAIDELHTEIGNNDTDIGNIQTQIDGSTTVDSTRSWTGLAATNISSAIQEIANTTISAGAGLTGGGNLQSNKTINVVGATDGGITVNANDIEVDSTVIRTTTTSGQTFNQNITFTTGNTLTIPDGATLDIDGTLLIGGGAGSSLSFDTAFVTLASSATQEGIEIDRSAIDINGGAGNATSPTLDAKIQWNEGNVASKPDRAWQAVGIDDNGDALTADLVTFYNAKDLLADSTEIDLSWNATNQQLSGALKTTGVTAQQYGGTTAIPVITIDSKGRITAAETANIVTELTFSAESNTGTAGHQVINLASETLHFDGVANQIVTAAKDDEIEFGLPTDLRAPGTLRVLSTTQSTDTSTGALRVAGGASIVKNLHVGGNLTVSGTQTIVNSNQVNIGDAVITLNSDETGTPSENAGIEVERGTSANKTLLWNETNGRWEADGVAIVTEATDFDNWKLAASGVTGTDTITSGETVTFAVTPIDNLDGLTVTRSGSTISYGHANTSTLSGNQGLTTNGNVLQTVTVDTYGHVTGVASTDLDNRYIRSWTFKEGNGEETGTISQGQTLHFEQGTGIEVEKTADRQLTIKNTDQGSDQNIFKNIIIEQPDGTDIQSWAADNNNDTFFIREVQVDSTSGIELTSINTGTNDRMGIAHANTSSYNSTPQITGGSATGTVITGIDVNVDTYGHTTSVSGTSYNLDNRYYRENEFASTNTANAPVVRDASGNFSAGTITANLSGTASIALSAEYVYVLENNSENTDHRVIFHDGTNAGNSQMEHDDSFKYNPSTNMIKGVNMDGNAATATLATTATNAENINVDEKNDNVNYQVLFSANNGSGYQRPYIDTDNTHLMYNPSTHTLTAGTFSGTATKSNQVDIDQRNNDQNYQVVFVTANSTSHTKPYIDTDDTHFMYNPSTQLISGAKIDYSNINNTPSLDFYNNWKYDTSSNDTDETVSSGDTVRFSASTGMTVNHSGKTITFTNSSPNVTTNISCSVSGNTVNVNSSDGTDGTIAVATQSAAGVMSKEDKTKLDGIATGAEVNQDAFAYIMVGEYDSSTQSTVNVKTASADAKSDTFSINFWKGFNVTADGDDGALVSLQNDRRSQYSSDDVYHGNTHDYMFSDASHGLRFYTAGAEEMRLEDDGDLHVDGDVIAFSTTVSDERLKENIQVVDNALEKVSQLKGVTFDWKQDGETSAGLIAQDVEKVLPSAVKEKELPLKSDDGVEYKTVEYSQITSLLVEAIKELKDENKELRAQIEALKDINR